MNESVSFVTSYKKYLRFNEYIKCEFTKLKLKDAMCMFKPRINVLAFLISKKEFFNNVCKYDVFELFDDGILLGADINEIDYRGYTPLHEAVSKNRVKCLELLCSMENIKLDIFCPSDLTPLMMAAKDIHKIDCAKVLCATKKVNINLRNTLGNNALTWAVFMGNVECAKLLLDEENIDTDLRLKSLIRVDCIALLEEKGIKLDLESILFPAQSYELYVLRQRKKLKAYWCC
jgi:ankyrin repeat protein